MPSTTPYKRGEVVLVPFPFTDLTSVKQRPAVVLSASSANQQRPDVIVAAITSQVPSQPAFDEWLVAGSELAVWGLPKPSVVKLGKLFTIHQGLIKKSIGAVPTTSLTELLKRVSTLFHPEDNG